MSSGRFCSGTGTPAEAWRTPHTRSLLGEPACHEAHLRTQAPPPQPMWRHDFLFMFVELLLGAQNREQGPADRTLALPSSQGPQPGPKGNGTPRERLEGQSPWPSTAGVLMAVWTALRARPEQAGGAHSRPGSPPAHPVGGYPWAPLDPGPPERHPGPCPGPCVSWGRELKSKAWGKQKADNPTLLSPGEHSESPQGCRQSGPLPPESPPRRAWTCRDPGRASPRNTDTPVWALVLRGSYGSVGGY